MKRFLIVILLAIPALLFAGNGQVWYQNNTEDAINVFNLEDVYYLPLRTSTWGCDSPAEGTMCSENYIGLLAIGNCTHKVTFSIETSGKFVSQSDPTKYREFCIAMGPRYESKGVDYQFVYDAEHDKPLDPNGRWFNTRATGTCYMVSPQTNGSNINVGTNLKRQVSNFWIDLVLCMEELDQDDLKHMIESDDYIATINLSWHCQSPGCTEHSGSYSFSLRGYYGTGSPSNDALHMFVNPEPSSQNINIRKVIHDAVPYKIANLQIHTNTRTDLSKYAVTSGRCTGYNWKDHVFAFISASPNYSVSNSEGFLLKKVFPMESGISIPFTLTVNNLDGSINRKYDGKTRYTGTTALEKQKYCIDLGKYTVSTDRYGNTYHCVDYYGDVNINISDPTGAVLDNANGVYSGIYEARIYYHIIYE